MSDSFINHLSQLGSLGKQSGNLREAFKNDTKRAERYTTTACGITLDYAKNLINDTSWQALQQLAADSNISSLRQQMQQGAFT